MQMGWSQLFLVLLAIWTSQQKLTRIQAQGQIWADYHINLTLGDPPVIIENMILDTGSHLTLFPCRNCMKCRSITEKDLYDPYTSFSSHNALCSSNLPICQNRCPTGEKYCQFSASYGQGSSMYGKLHQDTFYFNGDSYNSFKGYFGCSDVQNQVHDDQEAAIIGLMPNPTENILYGWFEKHPEDQFQFSTCFYSKGGFLQLGVDPEDEKLTPDLSAKFDVNHGFYTLKNVQTFTIGSVNVIEKTKSIFLDTGSSFLNVPQSVYIQVIHQISNVCQRLGSCQAFQYGQRFLVSFQGGTKISSEYLSGGNNRRQAKFSRFNGISSSQVNIFRPITLTVNGQTLKWQPEDFFTLVNLNTQRGAIPAYILHVNINKQDLIVLGNTLMQDMKLVTNLKEQTIKMYRNFNCTYTPTPSYAPVTFTQQVAEVYETVRSIKTEYLILIVVIHVLVAFLLWRFKKKIKAKWASLKKKVRKQIKRLQRKKKKYRKRKPLEANDSFNSAINSGNLQQEQKQQPTRYRRRGRKGHINRG